MKQKNNGDLSLESVFNLEIKDPIKFTILIKQVIRKLFMSL